MAKEQQKASQSSNIGSVAKKTKSGFFSFLKKNATVVKSKSNSDKTVFAVKDKIYEVETSHGRFKRFKNELQSGKNSVTHKKLTNEEKAFRRGVVQTMGAQAKSFKNQNKK